MGAITTPVQQANTALAARRVGGYAELVRLAREQAAAGGQGQLRRNADGRWVIAPPGPPAPPRT